MCMFGSIENLQMILNVSKFFKNSKLKFKCISLYGFESLKSIGKNSYIFLRL